MARERGVGRAQVSPAWLRRNPFCSVTLVGASKVSHLDDALASLEIDLTGDEVGRLEAPCTPRCDFRGISDDAELGRISARIGISPATS
jgi:aryl-alcohol dehydrogenase-like predicted oxidoreductase